MSEAARREAERALGEEVAAQLRLARGNERLVRDCVESYVRRGYSLGLTGGELVDAFCVSTPNILEAAGVGGAEANDIVAAFDRAHEQFVQRERPR